MEMCLDNLQFWWQIIYLDDIIIFAATPKEHLKRLHAVLSWLWLAGLKLQATKCEFFKVNVVYLGHEILKEGIQTNSCKVKVIKNWPDPIMVTELRSFLGFTNYYRCFIKHYVKVVHPSMIKFPAIMQLIRNKKFNGWMNARKPLTHWRFCAPLHQFWPLLTSLSPLSCIPMHWVGCHPVPGMGWER